ncbi:MAG: glycosyltransferase, partial [Vicinamibacteria bacterium]
MSLRVVVDARELSGHPTGVGRYLRELLVRWAQAPYAAGAECLLLGPQAPPDRDALCAAGGPGARLHWQDVPGAGGTWWEQGALARAVSRSGAHVLFAPAYSMPLAIRVPTVLAMHDVSFAAHPEWFTLREGLRRRLLARASAQKAAAIVTLTRFSARDIVARLGVRSARLHVIPLAVDYLQTTLADPVAATASAGESDMRRPTGVLFVGSIFERRNIPMLVAGVARAAATVPGFTLTLIGDNRT